MQILQTSTLKSIKFKQGKLFLWIWYADKIPPHIGCSVNEAYYSLKVSGKDEALNVSKVASLVDYKRIPFLLIETDLEIDLIKLNHVFCNYSSASVETATCLTPILELVDFPNEVCQLKDLLVYLDQKERIKHIFGVHLPSGYSGLKEYGRNEIQERLRKLKC